MPPSGIYPREISSLITSANCAGGSFEFDKSAALPSRCCELGEPPTLLLCSGLRYAELIFNGTPIEARIVALADVFDALTNKRCYKAAFTNEVAEKMIQDSTGSHFDPMVVDIMFKHLSSVREIQNTYRDSNLPDAIDQITMDRPPPHLIPDGANPN